MTDCRIPWPSDVATDITRARGVLSELINGSELNSFHGTADIFSEYAPLQWTLA